MRFLAVLLAAFAAATAAQGESVTPFYAAVAAGSWHGVVSSEGEHRRIPGNLFGAIALAPDGPTFVSDAGPTAIFIGSLAYGGRTVQTPGRTSSPAYGPGDVIAYGAGSTIRVVGGRTYRLPGKVVEVAIAENAFAATVETGDGKAGTLRTRLYLVTGGRTKLLVSGFDAYSERPSPQFSPDGSSIAYTKGGDVWVVDRSGKQRQITRTKVAAETDARWSPDGTRLAYTTGRHGVNEVYVATVEDGRELRLTHTKPRPAGFPRTGSRMGAWSPDGESIAVVTYNSVGVVPASGGTEHIVRSFLPARSAYVGPIWWSPSY